MFEQPQVDAIRNHTMKNKSREESLMTNTQEKTKSISASHATRPPSWQRLRAAILD